MQSGLDFILSKEHVRDAITDSIHMSAALTRHDPVLDVSFKKDSVQSLGQLFCQLLRLLLW